MKTKKKKVLLISPKWVNIHNDIYQQLVEMDYDVRFIAEYSFPEDPYRIKGKKHIVSDSIVESMKSDYWKQYLVKDNAYFDFLLVIDGQGINDILFNTLKSINPNIYCVNYLFDTIYSVYHFEKNFRYFNKVFTFDRQESEKYGIELLPIYWTPINRNLSKQNFDIFGFGTYSRNRYQLYKFINEIAIELGKKTFVKTYHNQIKNIWLHVVNNLVRAIIGKQTLISISEYRSDLIAHQLLPSSDFRNLIQSADVVLDSKVLDQDGLTARFMWALGAEKKIITTNVAAKSYPFFSKDQILVLDENKSLHKQKDVVRDFLSSDFEMSDERRNMIKRFRIDNWINTLLLK